MDTNFQMGPPIYYTQNRNLRLIHFNNTNYIRPNRSTSEYFC